MNLNYPRIFPTILIKSFSSTPSSFLKCHVNIVEYVKTCVKYSVAFLFRLQIKLNFFLHYWHPPIASSINSKFVEFESKFPSKLLLHCMIFRQITSPAYTTFPYWLYFRLLNHPLFLLISRLIVVLLRILISCCQFLIQHLRFGQLAYSRICFRSTQYF